MAELTAPANQDFTIYQGQDWSAVLELFQDDAQTIPFDLTGYEIDMQWREGVADSGAEPVFQATTRTGQTGSGRIVVVSRNSAGEPDPDGSPVPSQGVIRIDVASAVSSAIKPSKSVKAGNRYNATFFFDLDLISASSREYRVMSGKIVLNLEVTRRGE